MLTEVNSPSHRLHHSSSGCQQMNNTAKIITIAVGAMAIHQTPFTPTISKRQCIGFIINTNVARVLREIIAIAISFLSQRGFFARRSLNFSILIFQRLWLFQIADSRDIERWNTQPVCAPAKECFVGLHRYCEMLRPNLEPSVPAFLSNRIPAAT